MQYDHIPFKVVPCDVKCGQGQHRIANGVLRYVFYVTSSEVKVVPKLRALTGDITPSTIKCPYHYSSCTKLLQRFQTCCTWATCNVLQGKWATMYARVVARYKLGSVMDFCLLRNK